MSALPGSASSRRRYGLRDSVVLGFVLTVTILLAGAVLGFVNVLRLAENARQVSHSQEVVAGARDLLSVLKDAETGQRGYLLTGDQAYLAPYDAAIRQFETVVARLDSLTAGDSNQRARFIPLRAAAEAKIAELKHTVSLIEGGDHAAGLAVVRAGSGKALMDDVRAKTAAIRSAEEENLQRYAAETRQSVTTAFGTLATATLIGLVLVSLTFVLNQRNVLARQRAAEAIDERREYLRVTLASIGDAVITTGADGRIDYLNAVAESLTGWSLQEAVGQPLESVFRIVNEQTRQPVENPAIRALKENAIVGLANHTVLIRKDGSERPIDDSAAPIKTAAGGVAGCVVIFRDITDRRRLENAEASRLASARFLASIIESSEDAIVSKSLDGTIQTWNAAAERLFGYTAPEAIGRHISLVIPADRALEEDEIIARIRSGDRVDHFETVRLRKDGQPVHVSLTISPIRDEAGHIVGASKIARDIMDRKQAEERIYGLLGELKNADRRKDEFLAMLAHELRGPLAPVRNTLESLKRSGSHDEPVRQAYAVMDRQLAHLVRLVDDLIDVSRITRGTISLHKAPVELASIIHHSLEASRPLVEASRHQLDVSMPSEPIHVQADAIRLAQVFSNVLNNACKYTEPGGRISLTAERVNGDVVVTITDTGAGIPTDKLGTIFELFAQVDRTLERSQGGLGLGLALAKRLVEMHRGSIEAFSNGPGTGSRFVIRLPIVAQPEQRQVPAEVPPAAPRRILVVDDNADAASSLAMLLGMTGNETHTANDGLAAVDAAQTFHPDVILLDIGLPKLNGLEVSRRIRQQPWGQRIVMVALTGWGQEDDRRKSQEAGFNYHMVKPLDYNELMKLLASLDAMPS
jgi:PAS domain S-box-containing protein